ncbi:MAG TPA: hypothetical protein OIM34_08625 [Ruminococcus bromii]|nr:hypothetical protein [Ruminococcus bromii]
MIKIMFVCHGMTHERFTNRNIPLQISANHGQLKSTRLPKDYFSMVLKSAFMTYR